MSCVLTLATLDSPHFVGILPKMQSEKIMRRVVKTVTS